MIIAAEIVVIILMILGGAFWYMYHRTFGSMQKIDFNEDQVKNVNLSQEQIDDMKGYMTVACFGVDSRSQHGQMNVGKGTNADVNMIANINLETGEIRLVSVFRDSYLNINDKNSYNKINAAYAQGGPEQAVKALNKNLGLNITQYATFNWKAVADAINILGGVDVELSDAEFSWINAFITETVKETGIGSHQLTHAGNVHLDGIQAVAYGRIRYSDTDYARTERQRIILQKAFDKAKNADWATLNCLIQTIMPQLATNVDITDLIPLARNIAKFHIGETAGFPAARGEQDVGKIGDCVIPQTLEYNVKELHKFLFDEEDYQVPSNVKEYSNHIAQVTVLRRMRS
ncbi:LytR family transcriptional regulator [Clostridium sp. AF50-3]|uniref:LCP family protein n=1 Tax=Clostridium sp. AF21-20LB TaxID=2293003 RepID=UPI000E53C6AA|nr:LytR family transcriptional regulator [Clostridium sp. AF50-3]RHQ90886.1 LytR family transcriptional regulator [Clostridium sp. AF21-20LB]